MGDPKTFKNNFTDFAKTIASSLNTFKGNIQTAVDGLNSVLDTEVKPAMSKYWAKEEDSWAGGTVLKSVNQLDNGETTYIYYNSGLQITQDWETYDAWISGYKVASGSNESKYSIDAEGFLNTEDMYQVTLLSFSCSNGESSDMFPCAVWHNDGRIIAACTSGSKGTHTSSSCSILTGLRLRLTSTIIELTGNDVSNSGGFGWSSISLRKITY